MKKMYISPDIEILLLDVSDIITASGENSGYDDEFDTDANVYTAGWR